jgi:signal transduction histidine kinase
LVALLAGGFVAWTFLDEAAVQDETARASTVASQAMATLRTMWSEEHLANTLLLRPDQVDANNLESVRVELDGAITRLEQAVIDLQAEARGTSEEIVDRIATDTDELRSWLTEIRSVEDMSASDVATYQTAGDLLLDIIGQTSLNLDDRIKARELTAAESLAQAALVSFRQEQLVRSFISQGNESARSSVEQALNVREASFQGWVDRAADASAIAAAELADLAAMEAAVTGRENTGEVDINGFPTDRNELMIVVAERLAVGVADLAVADADEARSRALYIGGGVAAILLIAALATARIGRSLVNRVRLVTDVARKVADVELPNLVAALRNPGETLPTPEPMLIVEGGSDEVSELARSFSALHRTLVDVARQQMDILRKGVSEIFVTLARRNSSLVDRQLALIDQLESKEEDPEILGGYYKLDHLGTRMRRNAESLLVLAGTETPRMWEKPLEIGDAVRAALGEVDEYQRIDILALEPVRVSGQVVADIAHLLSELLDNATQFSPPSDRVRVAGLFDQDGYLITVSDHGMGMSEARQSDLNRLLASPPVLGLALEPTLGLYVVARLAARHGISVKLVPGVPGTTVRITVPRHLLETSGPGRIDEPSVAIGAPALAGPRPEPAAVAPVPDRSLHRTHPRPGHEKPVTSALPVRTAVRTSEAEPGPQFGSGNNPTPAPGAVAAPRTSPPARRYEAGETLPTRVPGAAFTESGTPSASSARSDMGADGIKTALSAFQAGRTNAGTPAPKEPTNRTGNGHPSTPEPDDGSDE